MYRHGKTQGATDFGTSDSCGASHEVFFAAPEYVRAVIETRMSSTIQFNVILISAFMHTSIYMTK